MGLEKPTNIIKRKVPLCSNWTIRIIWADLGIYTHFNPKVGARRTKTAQFKYVTKPFVGVGKSRALRVIYDY